MNKQNKTILNDLTQQIPLALNQWDLLWSNKMAYIDPQTIEQYRQNWKATYDLTLQQTKKILYILGLNGKSLKPIAPVFIHKYHSINEELAKHNNNVVNARVSYARNLILPVEGRALDEQQLSCIIKKPHNHLVLAGAGTGKTTTIIGYIKYLLKSGQCKPEDILVLSFTNASAAEMKERIIGETHTRIDASTFHKLGLDIITAVEGKKPLITSLSTAQFARDQLKQLTTDVNYLTKLCYYLTYINNSQKTEFDFTNQREYEDYLQLNAPITLNKERVKSYGEMDIANFLFQNRITYVYEKPYPVNTSTTEFGHYYPDFYLPDYDLYIEYFGVDRNHEVPAYFTAKPGQTPSQTYQAGIEWKRQLHKEHNTVMIELYAYEKIEGTLIAALTRKLQARRIALSPIPPQELWKMINTGNSPVLEGLVELFGTVISLIKSNHYSIDDVKNLNRNPRDVLNINTLLELIEPIWNGYQNTLQTNGEIDFNDMINLATRYILEDRYQHSYQYVIVDEYQDISKSRYKLLESMRKQKDYYLFCVGDDWQSIYQFSGSDISFILDFDKYWGISEHSKIETTYRFSRSLIDISGHFIMNNPKQKKKALRSPITSAEFSLGFITGYTEHTAVRFLKERLTDLPQDSSVLFLGRYRFDINLIKQDSDFHCQYNNITQNISITYHARIDLHIDFMSVHRSKGLQADYVFILNNRQYGMGFPSKITNAPILELLLESSDTYPYAEERRLFYVALTRARKKVWLLTPNDNKSEFVQELEKHYGKEIEQERYSCPLCHGRLVKRNGKYGEFLGCSNYRSGCHYTRDITKRAKLNN